MVKLIILFPHVTVYSPRYIEGYNDILIKLEQIPGVRKKAVNGIFGGSGSARFGNVVELYFDDRAALEAGLASPIGLGTGQALHKLVGPALVILFAEVMEEELYSNTAES